MIRMALDLLIVLVPLQIFLGDLHGLNTLEYQPAKIAAIEGRYDTVKPTPLTIFGIPDDKNAVMRDAIEIPRLGSIILTHTWDGAIKGLKEWPAQDRPPVALPFFAFRLMVGIGMLMLLIAIVGQVLMRWDGRLFRSDGFLRLCQWTAPLGFIAVIAGWVVTEVGRQPWTVYGLMRTADSVSPSLTGTDVAISLALYVIVYLVMYPTGIAFMAGLVRRGPAGGRGSVARSRAAGRGVRSNAPASKAATEAKERIMVLDLVPIWTVLIGLAVFYYVVFDGFDLGVGILYGFARSEDDRALMMNSIAPIWDGNETWLIFGGIGLLAVFPLAFAIIIPAVYFPIAIMLLALVFRGVAFEFRFKRPALRRFWDRAFAAGSSLATFAQGVVLGTFIEGFNVRRPRLRRHVVRLGDAVSRC